MATRPMSSRCSMRCRIERAAICGISFGGLIALRFAATIAGAGFGARAGLDARPAVHLKTAASPLRALPWLFGPVFRRRVAVAPPTGGEGGDPDRSGTPRVHAPAAADVSRRTAVGHTHGEAGAADRVVRSSRGLRSGRVSDARRARRTVARLCRRRQRARPATATSSRGPASSCWNAPDIWDRSPARSALLRS